MSVSQELGAVKEVELPAGTIRYRELGRGEPIVFVHGLLTNGDLWRKVVPALARSFRCITPDWPLGSHEVPMTDEADLSSPGLARLIVDFLAALNLEGVTLVGNDTGGALCQLVVTAHPDRIAHLVLTSCDAFEVFPPPLFSFLTWAARIPGGAFLAAQPLRFRPLRALPITYGWVMKCQPPPAVSDSYARPCYASPGVRRDLNKVLRGTSAEYTLAAARKFGQFDRPVLVAWATEDKLFPLALGERLARAFPDARFERIEESRTFVPEDQPERLSQLIAEFLRGQESRRRAVPGGPRSLA